MKLLEGKPIAAAVLEDVEADIRNLGGAAPAVVFVRVGEDPASVSYVESKRKTAERLGVNSRLDSFPETISEDRLLAHIDDLNRDSSVDAILVQAPLPAHIGAQRIFNAVHPEKDVDGFGNQNLGRLVQEDPDAFVACTPLGIQEMIKRTGIATEGRRVVVLGRSLIVGKPAALLFMQKGPFANATVTVAHSRSADLPALTREADILIAAIGRPGFVTASMVKDGATVIDVGINRVEDPSRPRGYRITGDVLFDEVAPKCDYITPVPGGVGLMTVAMLMHNTVKACRLRRRKK